MMSDSNLLDDPVIRRVAAIRPEFPDAELSADSLRAAAIADRITAALPTSPTRAPSRWPRFRPTESDRPAGVIGRAPALITCAAVLTAVAVVLVLTLGGSTGTQPAEAAIVRHIERQLNSAAGSILVTRQTTTNGGLPGSRSTRSFYNVLETPAGSSSVRNFLISSPQFGNTASINGDEEIYSPTTDTIYIANPWAPYIHPGSHPGTFVYRGGQHLGFPGVTVALTAVQAHALEDGTGNLFKVQTRNGHSHTRFVPLIRSSEGEAQTIRTELSHHTLRLDGTVELDGHRAYRLTGSDTTLYVDAKTYLPVKYELRARVVSGKLATAVTETWSEWKVLPITAQNERLLSLTALYPTARIDHNYTDYLHAERVLRNAENRANHG
jgi:hypothetical protein